MGIQKAVNFERVSWSEKAAAMIAPLVHDNVKGEFKAGIEAGNLVLWCVDDETYLVTSIEQFENKNIELVLEVIAGKNCRAIVAALIEKVKKMGVTSIRFETHHSEKVAKRFVGCLGFERVATVLRAEI